MIQYKFYYLLSKVRRIKADATCYHHVKDVVNEDGFGELLDLYSELISHMTVIYTIEQRRLEDTFEPLDSKFDDDKIEVSNNMITACCLKMAENVWYKNIAELEEFDISSFDPNLHDCLKLFCGDISFMARSVCDAASLEERLKLFIRTKLKKANDRHTFISATSIETYHSKLKLMEALIFEPWVVNHLSNDDIKFTYTDLIIPSRFIGAFNQAEGFLYLYYADMNTKEILATLKRPEFDTEKYCQIRPILENAYTQIIHKRFSVLIKIAVHPTNFEHAAQILMTALHFKEDDKLLKKFLKICNSKTAWLDKEVKVRQLLTELDQAKHKPIPIEEILPRYRRVSESVRQNFMVPEELLEEVAKLYDKVDKYSNEYLYTPTLDPLENLSSALEAYKFTKALEHEAQIWAALREVFHRVCGVKAYNTQLINAMILLKSKTNRVIGQVKTGEGKSTVMALMMAYQALVMQKSQLNVTTTEYLAKRDTVEFKAFYQALGIPCSMLTPKSELFGTVGVYYSASKFFTLWYVRHLIGEWANRGIFNFDQVGLFIDEVDQLLVSDQSNLVRIAKVLHLQFLKPETFEEIYNFYEANHNTELSYVAYKAHLIRSGLYTEEDFEKYATILKKWHQDCISLRYFRKNEHYIIKKIEGSDQFQIYMVNVETGDLKSASFMDGLLQLVRIKEQRSMDVKIVSKDLYAETHQFANNYIYSVPNKMIALTGTSGGAETVRYIDRLYPGTQVFDFPRYRPSRAVPLKPVITKNKKTQFAYLTQQMLEMKEVGRPLLIIFGTIAQTDEFLAYCMERGWEDLLVLNGRQKEVDEAVALAGLPGRTLITDAVGGRGLNLIPSAEALEAGGFRVLACKIPRNIREQWQYFGRTGRQGAPGDFGFVFNEKLLTIAAYTHRVRAESISKQFGLPVGEVPIEIEDDAEFEYIGICDPAIITPKGHLVKSKFPATVDPFSKAAFKDQLARAKKDIAFNLGAGETLYSHWLKSRAYHQCLDLKSLAENSILSDLLGDFAYLGCRLRHIASRGSAHLRLVSTQQFAQQFDKLNEALIKESSTIFPNEEGFIKLKECIGKKLHQLPSLGVPVRNLEQELNLFESLKIAYHKEKLAQEKLTPKEIFAHIGFEDDYEQAEARVLGNGLNFDDYSKLLLSAYNFLGARKIRLIFNLISKELFSLSLVILSAAIRVGPRAEESFGRLVSLLEKSDNLDFIRDQIPKICEQARYEDSKIIPIAEVFAAFRTESEAVRLKYAISKEKFEAVKQIYFDLDSHFESLSGMATKPLKEVVIAALESDNQPLLLAVLIEFFRRSFGFMLYSTQMLNIIIILKELEDGSGRCLAQIKTGEGKSAMMAIMMAYMALKTKETQCNITTNESLAERDVKRYRPFYKLLDLECGCFSSSAPGLQPYFQIETFQDKDILYGAGHDLEFGYLYSILHEPDLNKLFDKLAYIFVDEADAIMIDDGVADARVLSNLYEQDVSMGVYQKLWLFLRDNDIHKFNVQKFFVYLIENDIMSIDDLMRVEYKKQAMDWYYACKEVSSLQKNKDYIIQPNKYSVSGQKEIVLVARRSSGELQYNRQISNGVQQILIMRERDNGHNIPFESESFSAAGIPHVQFLKRFKYICGLTGTVGDDPTVGLYQKLFPGMAVYDLPRHLQSRAEQLPTQLCAGWLKQCQAIEREVLLAKDEEKGYPLLIFFEEIEKTEQLASYLDRVGYDTAVLNGKEDSTENVVALAGVKGQVTITTNKAARGIHIASTEEVEVNGGIRVLVCSPPRNSRFQWQCFGRTGRNGHNGTFKLLFDKEELAAVCQEHVTESRYAMLAMSRPKNSNGKLHEDWDISFRRPEGNVDFASDVRQVEGIDSVRLRNFLRLNATKLNALAIFNEYMDAIEDLWLRARDIRQIVDMKSIELLNPLGGLYHDYMVFGNAFLEDYFQYRARFQAQYALIGKLHRQACNQYNYEAFSLVIGRALLESEAELEKDHESKEMLVAFKKLLEGSEYTELKKAYDAASLRPDYELPLKELPFAKSLSTDNVLSAGLPEDESVKHKSEESEPTGVEESKSSSGEEESVQLAPPAAEEEEKSDDPVDVLKRKSHKVRMAYEQKMASVAVPVTIPEESDEEHSESEAEPVV